MKLCRSVAKKMYSVGNIVFLLDFFVAVTNTLTFSVLPNNFVYFYNIIISVENRPILEICQLY